MGCHSLSVEVSIDAQSRIPDRVSLLVYKCPSKLRWHSEPGAVSQVPFGGCPRLEGLQGFGQVHAAVLRGRLEPDGPFQSHQRSLKYRRSAVWGLLRAIPAPLHRGLRRDFLDSIPDLVRVAPVMRQYS